MIESYIYSSTAFNRNAVKSISHVVLSQKCIFTSADAKQCEVVFILCMRVIETVNIIVQVKK